LDKNKGNNVKKKGLSLEKFPLTGKGISGRGAGIGWQSR